MQDCTYSSCNHAPCSNLLRYVCVKFITIYLQCLVLYIRIHQLVSIPTPFLNSKFSFLTIIIHILCIEWLHVTSFVFKQWDFWVANYGLFVWQQEQITLIFSNRPHIGYWACTVLITSVTYSYGSPLCLLFLYFSTIVWLASVNFPATA